MKEILELADKLQEECHQYVNEIMNKPDCTASYQDVTNCWIFQKLAELQLNKNNKK